MTIRQTYVLYAFAGIAGCAVAWLLPPALLKAFILGLSFSIFVLFSWKSGALQWTLQRQLNHPYIGKTGKIIFPNDNFRLDGTIREVHDDCFFVKRTQVGQATGFFFSIIMDEEGRHPSISGDDVVFIFDEAEEYSALK